MILLIENFFEEFGGVMWKFVNNGKYSCVWSLKYLREILINK